MKKKKKKAKKEDDGEGAGDDAAADDGGLGTSNSMSQSIRMRLDLLIYIEKTWA